MNGLTVIPNMMADFQKECNRKLTDRSGAVNRNINNRDSLLSGKFIVNDIISRRKYSNQFDISAAGNCVPRNRGLVRYNDFRITNALGDDWSILVSSSLVNRKLTKFLQVLPTNITWIFRITV